MIKDIAVHLTGSEEDDVRLAHAEAVAEIFDAHLTGLFTNLMPEMIAASDAVTAGMMETILVEARERGDQSGRALLEKFEKLSVPHDIRRLDVFPGSAGAAMASEGRTADLFVATRPYGDPAKQHGIEETVLFKSGRGVLFVPPGASVTRSYGSIFVAWKDTREAARAVAEAMPFLKRAQQVVVGLVEEGGAPEQSETAPGAEIGRHLSRHGIECEIRVISGWDDAGQAILNEAKRVQAQMIVMGGYGHSRFREWLLGGATRGVVSEAPVPVLMAH